MKDTDLIINSFWLVDLPGDRFSISCWWWGLPSTPSGFPSNDNSFGLLVGQCFSFVRSSSVHGCVLNSFCWFSFFSLHFQIIEVLSPHLPYKKLNMGLINLNVHNFHFLAKYTISFHPADSWNSTIHWSNKHPAWHATSITSKWYFCLKIQIPSFQNLASLCWLHLSLAPVAINV